MDDFLDDFLGNKKIRKDPEAKFSVEGNKWDRHTRDRITANVKEFAVAAEELAGQVDTGFEAMSDTLLALFKVTPKLRDPKSMRPSYLINHAVSSELMKLKEYDKARGVSVGDPVATGLAAATLEPDLEVIFDRMKKAQEMAQRIEEMMQEAESYADKIDELLEKAQDDDEFSDEEASIEEVQAALDAIRSQIDAASSDLEKEIDGQMGTIQNSLRSGLNEVNESNEALNNFEHWGFSPGSIAKLDSSARLKLAKKLQTPQFKRMAEVIGRMQNMAMSVQYDNTQHSSDEMHQVTLGNDLTRMVPSELIYFDDDDLIYDWLHRYAERMLVQYELRGKERVNRGGIIVALDSSTSMRGERSVWAKGIALAFLRIAKSQQRPLEVIEFSGPGTFIHVKFDTTSPNLQAVFQHSSGLTEERQGTEAVIHYAETGLYGGTCFYTPFNFALELLKKEFNETGSVRGDIVFLTDGQASLDTSFIAKFKKEQERLNFNVYGIAIGSEPRREPLMTMCDGQVITLKRLTDVDDFRPMFTKVAKQ